MKYVAKPGTWFDDESVAELIDDYRPGSSSGLFRGWRNGKLDEEICPFEEFDMIDVEEWDEDSAWGGVFFDSPLPKNGVR